MNMKAADSAVGYIPVNSSGLSPGDELISPKLEYVIQRSVFGRHSDRRGTK